MAIIKPVHADDSHNVKNWVVSLIFNEHQTRVWRKTVLEVMDDGDRYLVAWYALWRKLPLQFYNWEWAARFKEVMDARKPPNSSYYYKKQWLDARDHSTVMIVPSHKKPKWDKDLDKCPWEGELPHSHPWSYGPTLDPRDAEMTDWTDEEAGFSQG